MKQFENFNEASLHLVYMLSLKSDDNRNKLRIMREHRRCCRDLVRQKNQMVIKYNLMGDENTAKGYESMIQTHMQAVYNLIEEYKIRIRTDAKYRRWVFGLAITYTVLYGVTNIGFNLLK